jgi:hypothetical protein
VTGRVSHHDARPRTSLNGLAFELRRCRIKLAEPDERLDVVGDEADRTWLSDAGFFDSRDERAELRVRLGRSLSPSGERCSRR